MVPWSGALALVPVSENQQNAPRVTLASNQHRKILAFVIGVVEV